MAVISKKTEGKQKHLVEMENNLIKINYKQERVGIKTFKTKYIAEVRHKGLNDYKVFTSFDKSILQNMVDTHVLKIEEKWGEYVKKRDALKSKSETQSEAYKRTVEANRILSQIDNILLDSLEIGKKDFWLNFIDISQFETKAPIRLIPFLSKPTMPNLKVLPICPNELLAEQVKLSFFGKLFKFQKEFEIEKAISKDKERYDNWFKKSKEIEVENNKLRASYNDSLYNYETEIEEKNEKYKKDLEYWELQKKAFERKQEIANSKIELLKTKYLNLETSAILEFCKLTLEKSKYPESFPKNFELDYSPETKILIIEYFLPSITEIPTLKEVKFISNTFKEYHLSESTINKLYDPLMYNITLKTMYEIFNSDSANAIEAISFNGWVDAINKATGKRENNCILSILAKKSEFMEIDLKHVEPKTCFKTLKGVSSSKLIGLTAIQPILQINKNDKRFTNHYEVANTIDSTTNLASMDWEDFEHLIREVFAQEFSSNGGEVRVTQASRDGGVDAIAFDPDPIRGGKIVIQAKRYTNTVGLSAVRDLYGTVMNEGATKGILVTTADYGPDAYEFVKGKPLTLLNGSNLLHLLEKHGHHARINIKEAREMMK